MLSTFKAGNVYFVLVFMAGFLLGTLRVTYLVPLAGEVWAVLLEMPLILAISWIVCARVVNYFAVPAHFAPRLVMGICALSLLLTAEFALANVLAGQSPDQFLSSLRSTAGIIGLTGQMMFALFPVMQGMSAD